MTPFDGILCGFAPCVPQPGTAQRLDTLSDRLMYRLAYRNFGSEQRLVVNHTVDVGSDRAGIRWYDLKKTSGNWGINQQSTYAPADGLHRWMGSAAMDTDGNMAIGFTTSNGTAPNYPTVKYVGRLATDPPNQLPQVEATLHAGTGSQTHTRGPLGRLLDDRDRPGRRLHLLVHERVHPDDRDTRSGGPGSAPSSSRAVPAARRLRRLRHLRLRHLRHLRHLRRRHRLRLRLRAARAPFRRASRTSRTFRTGSCGTTASRPG